MTSVLSLILHYQKYIEKCPNDEKRVLRCIDKLHQLGVTVQHLQETGVGRTINALRKEQGDVGKAARALVTKWKLMVAAEEDSSDAEDARQAPESPQDSGRESDDNDEQHIVQVKEEQCYSYDKKAADQHHDDHHSRKRPGEHERRSEQNKRSKSEHSSSDRNNYEERKDSSYANHSENDNDEDIENSDQASYEPQSNYNIGANASTNLEDKRHTDRLNRDKLHRYSEEGRDHSSQKSKLQTKDNSNEQTNPQSTSGSHHKSSRSDRHKESEHSSESKKHSSESQKNHHSKERSAEKREDRDKYASASESAKTSSSDKHRQSRDKEKEKSSSKSRSKDSSTEKHKKSSHDKEKSRDDSTSVSREKFKEKNKHSQNGESNSKSHSSDTGSQSSKEHSSKSRHESKKQSSHEGNGSNSRSKEKSYDKTSSKNRESKSSKPSSSNDCDVRTVSSKEVSEKPKKDKKVKIVTPTSEDSEDGIDCESGASFAEALGMVSPSKSKKKPPSNQKDSAKLSPVADMSKSVKTKSSSSSAQGGNSSSTLTNDVQIAALLVPSTKLAPLPAIEISALPEISTNYKPRPPPKLMASLNSDDEALKSVMSNKNQRTKVYSGNKIYGHLPSLYELCVIVLQEHIDALEYTGGVPYEILKPVVDRATPEQLFTLEHYNPYLMEDTNHLWQKHCEKRFRTKKRMEMETWREMYMRCQDEQDEKLKSLTANIKMSQEVRNAPTRQTKMAYVDSVVKPPRGVARTQAIHGTARAPVVSPAARVASLATGNVVKPSESTRPLPASSGPPMRSSSSFVKPKKAPLMQKALQFMKGRIKR